MGQQINLSLFQQLAVFSYDIKEQKKNAQLQKEKERALKIQAECLSEVNTALKILLKQREQDKIKMAHNLSASVKKLINPYMEEIKKTGLNVRQQSLLNIVESNIQEMGSPVARKLLTKNLNLTAAEIKIANLIKHGHTSKEISNILNISSRTVATHRNNIRKKIGIDRKKETLRFRLLSMESQAALEQD
jgi:DNA-binding CsgD family transcriptional regulator